MERLNIMFAQARAAEERDWIRFHSQEKYVEHLSDSILLSKKRLHNYKTAVDEENKRLSNIAAQLEQLSQEKEIKYVQLSALDDSLEEARVSLLHFAQLIKVVGTEIQSTIDYANNVDGDMFKKYERLLKGNCMKRNSIFMKDYYEVYKRERINAGDWDSTWANDYGWDNFVHQMLTIRIDWKIFFEVRNKHFEEVFEKLLEASKNQQDALDECSNIRAKVEERSRQELARRAEEALKEKEEIARMLLSRAIASWEALERSSRAQLDKDGEAIASGRSLLSELHTLHGLGTSHLDSSLRQPLVDLISLLTTTIPSYQRRHEEMEAQLKQTFAYKPQTSGKSLAYLEEHHMLLEDSIEEQRERLATYANENSFFRALQENVAPFSLPTHPTTLQAARGACVVHGIHEAIEERARMAQLAGNLEEQRDVVKNAYSKVEGDTSGIINGSINLFAPAFLGPSWVTKKRNRILEAELMWQKEADILGESEDELNLLAQDLDEKDETRKLQIESITTNSAWLHTPVLQELHRPLSPNEVLVSLEKAIRDEEETRSFSWGNLFKPLGSLGKNREERQSFLLSRVFQLQAFEKTSFLEQKAVIESGPLGDVIAALAERSIVRHQHNIRQLLSLEARVKGLPDMVHPSPEGSRPSVGRNEVPSDASLLPLCSLQLNAIRVPSTTELYLSSLVFEGEEVPSKPSETDAASQARQEEEAEEDRKMPSLPRVTTFTSPAAAQEAVEAYLERWNLETPAGRAALQEQGQEILKGVEALKKETASYPLVWDRVLEEQETTSVQLNRLTDLRVQLLHALLHTLPLQTTVHPTQRDDAASVQEDEDNSVEEVYTEYSAMPSNPSTSASASPSVARAQEEQEAEEPLPTPWQGVPFVQPEAPDLAAMLQRNL
ncbi:MAG: hypothetical protein GY874_01840, partial [Desulfobacteraceae bacterium]|nr:hypothetical protein [Desulfobacteraceae bacterium]